MNTPLSRRRFVERSALTAGLLGAAGLAPGTSHAADSTGSGNVPAVRPTDAREHGAKGDGKSADTAAIQRAIDAIGAAGGGVVYLPAGTYRIKPAGGSDCALRMSRSGVVLRGAGPG